MHRSRILALVAAAAAVLALTACGNDNDEGGDYSTNPVPVLAPPPLPGAAVSPPAPPTPSRVAAPAGPAGPAVGGVSLAARQVPGVGQVVADAQGFTLYRFDQDTSRPPAATCVAECATAWPPVVVDPEGALSLEGVERSAVGMVQRPDGSSQLTIAGWPVYRYADDTTPGAAGGQGVDGKWFAVTPAGGKAG
jgi:predicted lipoprotein with Yx(FWY)xxD motif